MDRHKPADPGAAPYVPAKATLPELWDAAQKCKGCDLYRHATQAVLGEGRRSARIMMVGEQPGDQEDRQGKPFVGPAGRLLDKALQDAGIAREDVYLTNAVKHFKFEERGKRRIHKKPGDREIAACAPWLEAEIGLVRPALIVCLGATAARAVIGREHRLLEQRGQFFDHPSGAKVMATVHPSAVLRAPDDRRHADYQAFVEDLASVHSAVRPRAKMHP
jgi:uracil-DNA glycosylase family protein